MQPNGIRAANKDGLFKNFSENKTISIEETLNKTK
jgi:hypothetical protein